MKTNREKHTHYWQEIDRKDSAAIANLFPDGIPSQFFSIAMYSAGIRSITSVQRFYKDGHKKRSGEKVLNKDVESAIQRLSEWQPPTADEIYIHYQERSDYGLVSGAERLSKINDGSEFAWSIEQLEPEIRRRKELYAPRDGYSPCQYCRRQNPPENMAEGTVIYRMNGGVHRKNGMYCKDKPCATHDQMGREG